MTYERSLLHFVRRPSRDLQALKLHWPRVQKQIEAERARLRKAIKDDDPIELPLDLLGPLARTLDETTHTRALAFLLDRTRTHGFGTNVLMELIGRCPKSPKTLRILRLASCASHIPVEPEFRFRTDFSADRSLARCDIRLEVKGTKANAIVIIENKIRHTESDGQLDWYEKHADKWCDEHHPAEQLLIYLTRHGDEASSSKWINLSYLDLACALRQVWMRSKNAHGSSWLRLYIATIARGLLQIDTRRATPEQIKTYLGAAKNG